MDDNLKEEEVNAELEKLLQESVDINKEIEDISEGFKKDIEEIDAKIGEEDEYDSILVELDEDEKNAEEEIEKLMLENAEYLAEEEAKE